MKRNLNRFVAVLLCLILLCCGTVFSACFLIENDYDIDDGFDDDPYVEPDYTFTISVTAGDDAQAKIVLKSVGAYGDYAQVVCLKNYEYLSYEQQTGVSEIKNAIPTVICDYECGSELEYAMDRYDEDGYDALYKKFYVIKNNGDIIAGPMYPTEIAPVYTHKQNITAKGIKGIMCDDKYRPEVADLGCEHTELNFLYTGMIVPNEYYDADTGVISPIEYTESTSVNGELMLTGQYTGTFAVEKYQYNGKTYYFRLDDYGGFHNLRHYDEMISKYTQDGVKVTLIMLTNYCSNQSVQPYFLTFSASHTQPESTLRAVNTSNEYGANYFGAFMEFIAKRYSVEDGSAPYKYGTVESYVMGNEIDQSYFWNSMVDIRYQEALTLEEYVTEYERMLRISNQAVKNAYSENVILISLTNRWNQQESAAYYPPKGIVDLLCYKTITEGNYNWGIGAHPYGVSLSTPGFWAGDKNSPMTGSLNTSNITWSNLEVFQLYLEQPSKMCNGKVRDVYITEGGVSSSPPDDSGMFESSKNQQAAGLAYAYYKCSQLSCIKALNYYRLIDNSGESAYFGLISADMSIKKPAYYVYKYIDTQYSYDVSDPYLDYIEWSEYSQGVLRTYGRQYGDFFDYKGVMPLYKSRFNWEEHWDESKIFIRVIDEDVDLGN